MAHGGCICICGVELEAWIYISIAGVTSGAVCPIVVLKLSCTRLGRDVTCGIGSAVAGRIL